jgi:hypothetical protein
LRLDSHMRDLAMYQYFLERNWVWENYSFTLESELHAVQHLLQQIVGNSALQRYCTPRSDTLAAYVRVVDAKGLYPKDLNNVNNPYFTITFQGLTWVGPIRKSTLNPVFDYGIPL